MSLALLAGDHRGFATPSPQQRRFDAIEIFDRNPQQRFDQLRYRRPVGHLHRQQKLAFLDAVVDQVAELRLHPAAAAGVLRQHDDAGIRCGQPFVDAGNEVIAGAHLPLVEPWVDSTLRQAPRQGLYRRLIRGAVTEENPHFGAGAAPNTARAYRYLKGLTGVTRQRPMATSHQMRRPHPLQTSGWAEKD